MSDIVSTVFLMIPGILICALIIAVIRFLNRH